MRPHKTRIFEVIDPGVLKKLTRKYPRLRRLPRV